ncbi:response regulator transcription factor [Longibacter sp.]|uniref:response regulator transcription factor n=1 Tax=Longibacter sp. TaxID=2045415 RepID=UPI003EBA0152
MKTIRRDIASRSGGPTALDDGVESRRDDIGVVLVDDHPAIRQVLREAIDNAPDMRIVGTGGSASAALPLIEERCPDVVVVDISLDGLDGLTLTRRIGARVPDARVLIFSMYEAATYAQRAVRAGASGYLQKDASLDKVIAAIKTVYEGRIYLTPDARVHVLTTLLEESSQPSGMAALTRQEMAIFQMLGEGTEVREIADRLDLSRKTVEAHRRHAKEKLGCASVHDLLRQAILWTRHPSAGPEP